MRRRGVLPGARSGSVRYYPAGATTHSEQAVTDFSHVYPLLEALEKCGMPLSVHGAVVDPDVDVVDREEAFIERVLAGPLRLAATITS